MIRISQKVPDYSPQGLEGLRCLSLEKSGKPGREEPTEEEGCLH